MGDNGGGDETAPPSGCELMGAVGILLQIGLAFASLSTLLFKRYRERPRRAWKIWAFDAIKQACSQGLLHILNVLLSLTFADPCVQYFLNLIFDTTIGVLILSGLVWFTKRVIKRLRLNSMTFGEYGHPPKVVRFLKQLALFLVLSAIMKVIIYALLLIPFFAIIATWMLSPLKGKPVIELLVVMVFTPLIMNTFQFWVVDQVIKKKKEERPTAATYFEEDGDDSLMLADNFYGIDEKL